MVIVEPWLSQGVAHVVIERTLTPVERAHTIRSLKQIEAAVARLQLAYSCSNAQRVAWHVNRGFCVGYVKTVERDVPVRRRAGSVFRNGVAQRHIQTCALQRSSVDVYGLVIKIDAAAAQREQSDVSLDTCRGYEVGCIEFGVRQFEAVDHNIAVKQRTQTHAHRKLAGGGNGVGFVAQGVVGLRCQKTVDCQV